MNLHPLAFNVFSFKSNNKESNRTLSLSPTVLEKKDSFLLENSLDALYISALSSVHKKDSYLIVPKYLYHLTSKKNFDSIMQSGKLKTSSWEKVQDGLDGVYMLDEENFLNTWFDKKYPSVFSREDKNQPSMAEQVVRWTSRGEDIVVIKVPTSQLDLSKLRIRPYLQAYNQVIETMNVETDEYDDSLFREGLPISKLMDYKNSDEPLEFVYVDEIPANIFSSANQFSISTLSREIAREIFN